MKYRELKRHLNNDTLKPAYYASGEDEFLVSAVRRLFREHITTLADININVLTNADGQEVLETCELLPLISDKRLVIVEDFSKSAESIERYLTNPNPSTVLLFIKPITKDWGTKLISKMELIDCDRLDKADILAYLSLKSEMKASAITTDAASLLIEYCGGDMTRIDSEADKLFDYRMNGTVKATDVETMVTPDIEFKIFTLTDAVSTKNGDKTGQMLKSLYDSKEEPFVILSSLFAHFRKLLFFLINPNSSELVSLLKVRDFLVSKLKAQAARFSPMRLKKICDGFHELDFAFKSGELSAGVALELQVMRILSEG